MHFQAKHADFAAKLTFFLILLGLALISFMAEGVDFRGYYGAAVLITRGGNPYDYGQLAPVLAEITGFAGNNPYFYPPWFSLIFLPFTLLPFQIARLAWLLLNCVLFYGSLRLLQEALKWRTEGWRKWSVYLAAALGFAAYCLRSEQAGVLLLFFLALALVGIRRRQPVLAGFALIMFASKPQVTILAAGFIAFWLFQKQRRSLHWAMLWSVLLILLASVAIPAWWQFDRQGFGVGLAYAMDGPDQIAAERVVSTVYDFSEFVLHIFPPIQHLLVIAIAAVGLALFLIAWRSYQGLVEPVAAVLILTFLITPYALQYDYVLLTLPFMWTVMQLENMRRAQRLPTILLLAVGFSVLIWQEWSYQGYLQLPAIAAAFAFTMLKTRERTQMGAQTSGNPTLET